MIGSRLKAGSHKVKTEVPFRYLEVDPLLLCDNKSWVLYLILSLYLLLNE